MAKKFFYVCAGLLCLVASYHMGATSARAQAGTFRVLDSGMAIEAGGQIYSLDVTTGWRVPSDLPPVSASAILAGKGPYITQDGTAWAKNGYTGEWVSYPLPTQPTSVQQGSWGALKAKAR